MRPLSLAQSKPAHQFCALGTPGPAAQNRRSASELFDSHKLRRYSETLFSFLFVTGCSAVLLTFLALAMRMIFLQFSGFDSMELLRGFAAVSAAAPN
ncbi:MAG: hypothetical protein NXI32_03175 [bacterium]|nr:hypothetical protein [bacterium]